MGMAPVSFLVQRMCSRLISLKCMSLQGNGQCHCHDSDCNGLHKEPVQLFAGLTVKLGLEASM